MATIDPSIAEDRIRLACGDTSDLPYLTDDIYTYCLSQQSNNEPAATKMAAQLILAQLSYGTHQRLGAIEQWGSEAFNQYLTYIKQVITNPSLNATGGIYVGGLDLEDARNNKLDTTIVQQKLPVYPYNDYSDPDETVLGVYQDSDYF